MNIHSTSLPTSKQYYLLIQQNRLPRLYLLSKKDKEHLAYRLTNADSITIFPPQTFFRGSSILFGGRPIYFLWWGPLVFLFFVLFFLAVHVLFSLEGVFEGFNFLSFRSKVCFARSNIFLLWGSNFFLRSTFFKRRSNNIF